MKHYVINLKDKPNRLTMWVGGQYAQDFPIEETLLCYGIDGREFDSLFPIADLAMSLGVDWQIIHHQGHPRADETGHASLRLGIDLILHHIKDQPSGWYAIWHDDEILNMPYHEFLNFFETTRRMRDIQVVACNKDCWFNEAFPEGNERGEAAWASKESKRHPMVGLYHGCVGSGFDRCLVVTPEGAEKLLSFGEVHAGASYEWLSFYHLPENNPYFWTAVDDLTRDIGFLLGSDIDNHEAGIPMQTIDLSERLWTC